jgi:glucose/mannose-6-phosphate isomerase
MSNFSRKAIANPVKFMLGLVEEMPNQIREARKNCSGILLEKKFKDIYLFGMGGSGITGDLLKEYLIREHKIRAYSAHNYEGPFWMDKDSLAVILSYSGNTEEAISCYNFARKKGSQILILSSDGNLKKIAKRDNINFVELEKGIPPRSSVCLMFFSILQILENSGIVPKQEKEVEKTINMLSSKKIKDNGKILVDKIIGKTPLIYASPHLAPIAYRWKTEFNENAKKLAFWNYFPELNHNELEAFGSPQSNYHVIILSDEEDSGALKKRIEITKRYITRGSSLTHIMLKGNSFLSKMFYSIALGDFASIYQAVRDNKNPLPVSFIEEFKQELKSGKKE